MSSPVIPNKIPRQILKKNNYDEIILFTLGIFGPQKREVFINNRDKYIFNRIDEKIFQHWIEILKKNNYIEECYNNKEIYYRITAIGEQRLMNRLEKYTFVKQLIKIHDAQ